MGALSKYLRNVGGGGLAFWCQGCKEAHVIRVGEGPGPRWTWNGDVERPVFGPSVLVRSGHYAPHYTEHVKAGGDCWCIYNAEQRAKGEPESGYQCAVCHTFIGCNGAQPGEIIFLGDCTHELAGQVLPLAEMPGMRSADHE